jgi:hypothetical protein
MQPNAQFLLAEAGIVIDPYYQKGIGGHIPVRRNSSSAIREIVRARALAVK